MTKRYRGGAGWAYAPPVGDDPGGACDMSVQVRPATSADDAALVVLDRTSWSTESGFPSVFAKEQAAFFSDRNPPGSFLVAELDGVLVGYVKVELKYPPLPEAAHVFGIRGLVVARRARRAGVASALLVAAEDYARSRGGRKLSLNVLGGNVTAQRLYARHGYVLEGRHRAEFVIDGGYVDDLTLAKEISPLG